MNKIVKFVMDQDLMKNMIKANSGCFVTEGTIPIVDLVCDQHTASEVYCGYDGKVDKICDYFIER